MLLPFSFDYGSRMGQVLTKWRRPWRLGRSPLTMFSGRNFRKLPRTGQNPQDGGRPRPTFGPWSLGWLLAAWRWRKPTRRPAGTTGLRLFGRLGRSGAPTLGGLSSSPRGSGSPTSSGLARPSRPAEDGRRCATRITTPSGPGWASALRRPGIGREGLPRSIGRSRGEVGIF